MKYRKIFHRVFFPLKIIQIIHLRMHMFNVFVSYIIKIRRKKVFFPFKHIPHIIHLLSALMQFPRASSDLFIWAPSTIRFPRLCVFAALSDPARSIIKSLPILTSCVVLRTRFCCLTDTWRTAWDREDVLFAAVGSCVLSLFPFSNMSIT